MPGVWYHASFRFQGFADPLDKKLMKSNNPTRSRTYLAVPIIDEFDGPAALVFDPDEDDSTTVAGGQPLVRLVPLDQNHLQHVHVLW